MSTEATVQRPLWTLPISDSVLNKLKDAGYEYLEDVICDANKEEVKQLLPDLKLDFTKFTTVPTSRTALELYKDENEQNGNVVTFSKAFDDLLGGGIPTSRITEIVGAPGTGKTQICLQLCSSVQIPEFLGGLFGSAVYIETNSNFSISRIREIHAASTLHCWKISFNTNLSVEEKLTVEDFRKSNPLLKVTKYAVETVEELRASVFAVQRTLEKTDNNIRLVIIDSFTFPFYSTESNLERTKIISDILSHLNQLAATYHLAVVVTNELTTCILDSGTKEIIPSLGETFAHIIHNRIFLGQKKATHKYTAILHKSSEFPSASAYFQITKDGIRDVPVS